MKFFAFSPQNITDVLALSNHAFGKNYLPLAYYKTFINTNRNIGIVIQSHRTIIGFITAKLYLTTSEDTREELYFNFNVVSNDIAIIKQVVVSPDYQKKGIGNLLLNQLTLTISTKEIICVAWQRNKLIIIESLLLKNNFKKVKTIPNYWFNDSISKQYNCPECKKPPCKCSGIVYTFIK